MQTEKKIQKRENAQQKRTNITNVLHKSIERMSLNFVAKILSYGGKTHDQFNLELVNNKENQY